MHPAMLVTNFILFQVGWFACVLGAAWDRPWSGPIFALVALVVYATMVAQPRRSLLMVAIVTAVGCLADGLLAHFGVLQFSGGGPFLATLPLWMVALWLLFATTLDACMRWLHGRPVLAFALGGCVGPLAYFAGERLGALRLGEDIYWIAVVWAVLLPAGAELARQLTARPAPRPQASPGYS